jgi:putative lipase involved disintegration of autophagic bodies
VTGDLKLANNLIGEKLSKDTQWEFEIISKGELVQLRSLMETDLESFNRWQKQGEWQRFDAPWEESVIEESCFWKIETKRVFPDRRYCRQAVGSWGGSKWR